MAAAVKNKLKAARDAISKRDYPAAQRHALSALDLDAQNYNAYVFLGLASLELGQLDAAEKAYLAASQISSEQILAWQGLSQLFERSGNAERQLPVLEQLAKLQNKEETASKCIENLNKILNIVRASGSRTQLIKTLGLFLPTSPYNISLTSQPYDSLSIYKELVSLIEKDERESIDKEIERRRMRLDTGRKSRAQLEREVGFEVWTPSQLPSIYSEIINHQATPDDLRRETESKLLRFNHQLLVAIPSTGDNTNSKQAILSRVKEMVDGMVLLKIPDELAWNVYFNMANVKDTTDYGLAEMRSFVEIFPQHNLSKLLTIYLQWCGLSGEDEEDEATETKESIIEEDSLDKVSDLLGLLSDSILAHKISADIQYETKDFEASTKTCDGALTLVRRMEVELGIKLDNVHHSFTLLLGASLTFLSSPTNHDRASQLLRKVLARDPVEPLGLLCTAHIAECAERWAEAGELWDKVLSTGRHEYSAREGKGWSQIGRHDYESGIQTLEEVLDELPDQTEDIDVMDQKARVHWKLGKALWDSERDQEAAYRHFIAALKLKADYAPAFTSLGLYYLQKEDSTRSSKCFQKAFELDAREVTAAKMLAKSFSAEREWELVEVIARRVVEGEGSPITVKSSLDPSDGAAVSITRNLWAWKALGVVELNQGAWHSAIQSWQVVTRVDPQDHLSWTRLGEAYLKAGRHEAGLKCLLHSQELCPDQWMCLFLIGEVYRQTGQFEEAIESYEKILNAQGTVDTVGVQLALADSHLSLGLQQIGGGFLHRAESSFASCIVNATDIIVSSAGLRRLGWKRAGDAVMNLSKMQRFSDETLVRSCLSRLVSLLGASSGEPLARFMEQTSSKNVTSPLQCLQIAIKAYAKYLELGPHDIRTRGAICFDLGVTLRRLSQMIVYEEKKELCWQEAVRNCKRAIQSDLQNPAYWTLFGDLHFFTLPKLAQHAYIQAIDCDAKDSHVWTRLGLLYLHNEDYDLAKEVLVQAQVSDPQYPLTWVSQSMVAKARGASESLALLEYATGLPNNQVEADLGYAQRSFDKISKVKYPADTEQALIPLLLAEKYLLSNPGNTTALHLKALLCERLGKVESGIEAISICISSLESLYEDSEDPTVERQFVIAQLTSGRLHLMDKTYETASEAFQTAVGLLAVDGEEQDPKEQDETTRRLRIQGHWGLGLAQYHLEQPDLALSSFTDACDEAEDFPDLGGHADVLVARMLWALGDVDGAQGRLLERVSAEPEHLHAIATLAGIGLLSSDESLIDAALSEIKELNTDIRTSLDPTGEVVKLVAQHHIRQGNTAEGLRTVQKLIKLRPTDVDSKTRLAEMYLQTGEPNYADAILSSVGLRGEHGDALVRAAVLRTVARSAGSGGQIEEGMSDAQKTVMTQPWNTDTWLGLANEVSRTLPV